MEQKVVITGSDSEINRYIVDGWLITSVTAQHVSVTGDSYATKEGKFCFVLERIKK